MHSIWNELQSLLVTKQRLCEQVRMICRNEWLTELQLADIKKRLVKISVEDNEDYEIYLG